MSYNISINSQIESNINIGNVSLNIDELLPIIRTTTADDVHLSDGDVLALDCDLGAQVKIDEIRYYFDSTAASGVVASTINIYYKYDEADVYTSLNTFVGSGYYYSTITSGTGAPRYIRIVHTVSGTVSGTVNGLEVTNDDNIVDFGPNGQRTAENFDVDLGYSPELIRDIQVYNDGSVTANVHIILEPQGTLADEVLSISTSEDGPWFGPKQTDNEIAGLNTWDQGNGSTYADITYDDRLRILPGQHFCQYTTKIFDTIDTQKFTFLYLDVYYPTGISGTIFEEDFSGGNAAALNVWQLIQGTADYSDNYMHHTTTTTEVASRESFNYGEDWYMELRGQYDTSPNIGGWASRFWPIYTYSSPGSLYIEWSYYQVKLVLNGVSIGGLTSDRRLGKWVAVKIRRDFYTLKAKGWYEADEPEPVDWEIVYDLNRNELATSGKLWAQSVSAFQGRWDDILLQTNVSTQIDTPAIVAVSGTDTRETVEIKSSNKAPLDYIAYRKFYNDETGNRVKWSDFLLYDDSYLITYNTGNYQHRTNQPGAVRSHIDRSKEASWTYYHYWPTNTSVPIVVLRKYDIDGTSTYSLVYQSGSSGNIAAATNCYALKSDYNQNIWIYIYSPANQGEFSDGEGYYLFKYDATLTQTFKLYEDSYFIYDMDVVYATGELWYTNYETHAVMKLDSDGNIIVNYTFTDEVKGIATDSDGGCWVVQLAKLYHLNSDGDTLLDIIDYTDTAIGLSRIAVDGDSALWITDGHYVRRIYLDGSIDFSIEFEDQPVELKVYENGVAVLLVNRNWHFISRYSRRVIKVVENEYSFFIDIGVEGGAYDNPVYASKCPVLTDTAWSEVPWKVISVNDYTLPDEQYHQIRLTLRDINNNYLSPLVNGLYLNESILKYDVLPGNYTTIYMKADSSGQTETGNFTSNLKAWWYIENN